MMTGRREVSARFLRSASDIIERVHPHSIPQVEADLAYQCERLSNETGCWLHFSAQHMFATEPFHFNRTFLILIAARNEESKEMHKKLLAVQEKEKAAKDALAASQNAEKEATREAETAKRQLELKEQEMEAQRLELEMWKAKLKVAEQRTTS